MKSALSHIPRTQHQMVASIILIAFVQETYEDAITQWRRTGRSAPIPVSHTGGTWTTRWPTVGVHDSPRNTGQISSTNPLERINKEIKQRTNVVSILPND